MMAAVSGRQCLARTLLPRVRAATERCRKCVSACDVRPVFGGPRASPPCAAASAPRPKDSNSSRMDYVWPLLCFAGRADTQNGLKLSTAIDLISPSAAAEGPSRRQARKQKRRAAERQAQQQLQAQAAASLPSVAGSRCAKGDAVRRGQPAASGAVTAEQGSASAEGPFAGLPAAIATFMQQQGFDAPTAIQNRCAAW